MKKTFLFLLFLSCSDFANAQQDSILVVIECDSLYRPFIIGAEVTVDTNTVDNFISRYGNLKFDSNLVCRIPKPLNEVNSYGIHLDFKRWIDISPSTVFYITNKNWYTSYYDWPDKRIVREDFTFELDSVIRLKISDSCIHNQYIINNSCPSCGKQDSVSWIAYGGISENPITGIFDGDTAPFFNPYNNPYILPHYLGGCEVSDCQPHWYCNRCKREY